MLRRFTSRCPHCAARLKLAASAAGLSREIECPDCHAILRITGLREVLWLWCGFFGLLPLGLRALDEIFGTEVLSPTVLLLLLPAVPLTLYIALRRTRLHRHPHECRTCGYDVHACTGERCPECGTPLPDHLAKQPQETG